MSFYVVERDPDDGSLRSVTPGLTDRAAAIEMLQDLLGSGSVTVTGDLFVLDLDSAAPVIVLPAAPAPEPAPEPLVEPLAELFAEAVAEPPADQSSADASPADEPPTALGEPEVIDVPVEAVQDEVAQPDPGSDLASALRRAAVSLESEGVVAPESVPGLLAEEEDAVPDAEEDVVPDAEEEDSVPHAEEPRVEPVGEDWPWMGVTAVEDVVPDVETEEPEPAVSVVEPASVDEESSVTDQVSALLDSLAEPAVSHIAEPAGVADVSPVEESSPDAAAPVTDLDDPSVEDSPLIVPSAIDDEVYLPRPVILGDYEDEGDPAGAAAETPSGVAADTEPVSETDGLPEIDYVPSGTLDLDAYTCDDCVYVYTCPKVGESTPKECGSFQWKSN